MKIISLASKEQQSSQIQSLLIRWQKQIEEFPSSDYALGIFEDRIGVCSLKDESSKPLCVDFLDKTKEYRRKHGGGKAQMIAKAVGIKKGVRPHIVDATAGLGGDAFVFASLGCKVHMIERSIVMGVLLEDGLARAREDVEIGEWIKERMTLDVNNSIKALSVLPFKPDTIYLDPMYPEKIKSALVKKDMRMLKSLVGHDEDAGLLFEEALKCTQERVVVKRPLHADWMNDQKPSMSLETKKNRFDLYLV